MAQSAENADVRAREQVRAWLNAERAYTLKKFGLALDDQHIADGFAWWSQQFDNYLHRAEILGLDSEAGRQALAKFVATAVGMLEACVRHYGPLPVGGVPSGYNITSSRDQAAATET